MRPGVRRRGYAYEAWVEEGTEALLDEAWDEKSTKALLIETWGDVDGQKCLTEFRVVRAVQKVALLSLHLFCYISFDFDGVLTGNSCRIEYTT